MSEPKVYVIHNPNAWNEEDQQYQPKHDISSAASWGRLTHLLGPTANPHRPEPIVRDLQDRLSKITVDDYLLLIGSPCFIAWASAIAAQVLGGRMRVLVWSRDRGYTPLEVDLFTDRQDNDGPQSLRAG